MAQDATATLAPPVLERRRRRNWRRYAGLSVPATIAVVFIFCGAFAGLLSPDDPNFISLAERLQPPVFDGGSWDHPLGTDDLGRDILSRILHGAQVSLIVVLAVVPGAAVIGTTIGLVAGWRGGLVGNLLMRLTDIQLALPSILFAVLLGSIFGPSLRNVIIILLLWTWSAYSRLVRAEAISLRERDFVTASRAVGAGGVWIMRKHLLPNLLNTVVIVMTLEVAIVILAEAALSFLGVGVPAGTASWGRMITEARTFMVQAWWMIWLPGIALMVVAFTGNLMGDWLRDALDPRLRNVR
ncbi:MAG: peptide/nickel transport system permease protein [Chloroflexi bacterium]|jgi:peptide/nickel transport system permease protein|nr:MAG: peptide/nickel transport system permease protein [Chloroflexota bacterium]